MSGGSAAVSVFTVQPRFIRSFLVLHVFRMYRLQLHFSLSLSFMFLCLLSFTIKVSQGKFVSVPPPPPHTLWQLPMQGNKHSAGTSPVGFAARSQPESSRVPVLACVRLSLCLSCGRTAPGMHSPPRTEMPLGLPPGHPRSRAGTRFSLKSILRPSSARTQSR